MTFFTFFSQYFYENVGLYIISLIFVLIIYIPIFKKTTNSIVDPMFFALVVTVFANSIPVFLYILNVVSPQHIIYFVLSECVFWLSYFSISKSNINFSPWHYNNIRVGDGIFYVSIFLLWSCQLLTYGLAGIPVLMESRLDTYSSGGGIGLLSYIINFCTIYCSIYSYYLLGEKRLKRTVYFTLLSIVVFSILSGSRSSVLVLLYSYFFYRYYFLKKQIHFRDYVKYLPFVGFFPIAVILISNNGDLQLAVISLFNRFIANGDVYWNAYPNDIINSISIERPFYYLFSRILGPFRLIDYSQVDTVIGLQLSWEVNPSNYGINTGPNTRLPILNWVLFKWNGLFLSLFFGLFCAWWKTRLFSKMPQGIIPTIIYAFVYINLTAIFTDPLLGTGSAFVICLFLLFIFVCVILFGRGLIVLRK